MSYSIFEGTLAEKTWPEADKIIKEGAIALLPTGVIEEHGPHMSLGVDAYMSTLLSRKVMQELMADGIKTVVAPPYYWGINNVTGHFPGSFTVRMETFKAVIYDILSSMKRWGIDHIYNINWHDDQYHCSALLEAISTARVDTGVRAFSVISDILAGRLGLSGREEHVLIYKMPLSQSQSAPTGLDLHAGAGETSVMAAYFPDEVNLGLAKKLKNSSLSLKELMVWRRGWSDAASVTPLGYAGDPARFDGEEGKRQIESLCSMIAGTIKASITGSYIPPEIKMK